MKLEDLLSDKNYNNMINKYMYENYSKCKLYGFIEFEDYRQEIYIYLLRHIPRYDESKASLSTYLYLCINTKTRNLIRHYKSETKDKFMSLNAKITDKFGGKYETIEILEDELTDIEEEAIANATTREILNMFKDEEVRNIVLLLMDGYSKRDICKILKFGYTKMFNKLGNVNKVNTIKYMINRYYQQKEA